MATTYTLEINGRRCSVAVDYDDTPLLYVLRDDLDLKGTRFGCGDGQCGACTVLLDGRAERSCELAVSAAAGKPITTIEGLGTLDAMHPLQQAVVDFQAGQCGYCLSGIIMKAAELINEGGAPDRQKIGSHLKDNLCRCGVQARIIDAVEAAWQRLAKE